MTSSDTTQRLCIWGTSVKKVGDEAQLASTLTYLLERYGELEVTVFSTLSERVEQLFNELGVTGRCVRLKHLSAVTSALRNADGLVIIGGPFFEDRYQMASIAILFTLAKLTNTRMVTFGTTLFPANTAVGQRFYRWAYSRLDAISSRDSRGAEVLAEFGVQKTLYPIADLRYLLHPSARDQIQRILRSEGIDPTKPYVTLTTRYLHDAMPPWVNEQLGYSSEQARQSYQQLASFIAQLSERFQVVIVPMHPTMAEDQETAKLLFSQASANTFVLTQRYTPFDILGLFRYSAFSIHSRVGSTVFSVIAGTPFVAVSYESRMEHWMRDNGMDTYWVDWKAVNASDLITQCEHLQAHESQVRQQLAQLYHSNKTQLQQQAEIILSHI